MKKTPNIAIIYNSLKNKNSKKIAKKIAKKIKNCIIYTAEDHHYVNLEKFNFLFFIISNTGDEELPCFIEDYFYKLNQKNKKYFICELGNYFGLEYKGCKKIAVSILIKLNWKLLSDVSLDSVPDLDYKNLYNWLKNCKKIIKNEYHRNNC
jgi:flavodoxin